MILQCGHIAPIDSKRYESANTYPITIRFMCRTYAENPSSFSTTPCLWRVLMQAIETYKSRAGPAGVGSCRVPPRRSEPDAWRRILANVRFCGLLPSSRPTKPSSPSPASTRRLPKIIVLLPARVITSEVPSHTLQSNNFTKFFLALQTHNWILCWWPTFSSKAKIITNRLLHSFRMTQDDWSIVNVSATRRYTSMQQNPAVPKD